MSATVAPLKPLRRMARCAASTRARSSVSSTTPAAFIWSVRIPFSALGAVWIGSLCTRRARTRVLAVMFGTWTVFMGLTAFSTAFVMFIILRQVISVSEATDPAVYPLIGDFWRHEQRAQKVSIFNAGAGIGAFIGIAGAGILVD